MKAKKILPKVQLKRVTLIGLARSGCGVIIMMTYLAKEFFLNSTQTRTVPILRDIVLYYLMCVQQSTTRKTNESINYPKLQLL